MYMGYDLQRTMVDGQEIWRPSGMNDDTPTREEWLAFRAKADAFYEIASDEWIELHNLWNHLSMYYLLKPDRRDVYLMRGHDGLTKIGISERTSRRVADVARATKQKVTVLRSWDMPNAAGIEQALHNHFHKKNVRGEWFNLTDDDIAEIERLMASYSKVIEMYGLEG